MTSAQQIVGSSTQTVLTAASPPGWDPETWQFVMQRFALPPRHVELVALLVQGKQDKEVADAMGLSLPTVRTYLDRIRKSVKAHDRLTIVIRIFEAAMQAQRRSKPDDPRTRTSRS